MPRRTTYACCAKGCNEWGISPRGDVPPDWYQVLFVDGRKVTTFDVCPAHAPEMLRALGAKGIESAPRIAPNPELSA